MFIRSSKASALLGSGFPIGFNYLKRMTDVQVIRWSAQGNNMAATPNTPSIKCSQEYKCISQAVLVNSQGCVRRNYSTESASTETPSVKLSKRQLLKRAFKEYGATIVAFHVGISVISLGGIYALVSTGINLVPVLEFLGIGSSAIAEKVATGSTFVVAYAVHKVFAPARISVTLGATPLIVRYLRSKGLLKPKA
ncbi:protein FAM210B, mitochondrial [Drosophila ficusphila]|uniref:protein FAM210B, mitochondrial n=1 Tax=Drosophila ficusphila TaxID=30025 RepID=UPI0007E8887F|nr:protein FAM210B, mitochondrial [Drosophila ficusphila]